MMSALHFPLIGSICCSLSTIISWLLTYLVHSTLLLGAAWLIARRLGARALPLQEGLWRLALLGGLFTAGLQAGAGLHPVLGHYPVAAPAAPMVPHHEGLHLAVAALPAHAVAVVPAAPLAHAMSEPAPRPDWTEIVVLVWLFGGLLCGLHYAHGFLRLSRRLRGRVEIQGGPLWDLLADLCCQAGLRRVVRLTCSPRVTVPIALGLWRREICVPARLLGGLPPAQQQAVLGHELAHLLRRDPAWLLVCGIVERLFFFQPLNRVARRQLHDLAEYLCDDWSVARTRAGVALARCLTEVAGWALGEGDLRPLPVPGMARLGSCLGRRVGRLLEGAAAGLEGLREVHAPRWLPPLGAGVLLVLAACAPGVTVARAAPPCMNEDWAEVEEIAEDPLPPPRVVTEHHYWLRLPPVAAMPAVPAVPAVPPVPAMPPMPAVPAAPAQTREDMRRLREEHRRLMQDAMRPVRELAAEMGRKGAELGRAVARGDHEAAARLEQEMRELETRMRPAEAEIDRLGEVSARLALSGLARAGEAGERAEEARQRLDEAQQRLEEQKQRLEEQRQRLEEQQQRLEEQKQRLEEQKQRLDKARDKAHPAPSGPRSGAPAHGARERAAALGGGDAHPGTIQCYLFV